MKSVNKLRAGAATIAVQLNDDCFPNAEFVGMHDAVFVRCVIIQSNLKFALLSVDMPSMNPSDIQYCREVLKMKAGIEPGLCWITVNHSFSAPHLFRMNFEEEMKNTQLPPVFREYPGMMKTAERINSAYYAAINEAVDEAVLSMREASIGFGKGTCSINVNRNMYTADGWWQGVNQKGFADHILPVIRLEDQQGKVIAIIYNYSCQASVTQGSILPDGGRLVSSDLPGAACSRIEQEFGECTAIFLPGATSDQVPLYRINYTEVDRNGHLRSGSYGEAGYLLLEEQGRLLGNAVIDTAMTIRCDDRNIEIDSAESRCICDYQKRDIDMSHLKPSLNYTFIPDGQCELPISFIRIGDIAMVGLTPEMDGANVACIREKSAFEKILVSTFVNGNEKSMPQRSAYGLFQYGAMNSPFAAGSGEKYSAHAVKLINEMYVAGKRVDLRGGKIHEAAI